MQNAQHLRAELIRMSPKRMFRANSCAAMESGDVCNLGRRRRRCANAWPQSARHDQMATVIRSFPNFFEGLYPYSGRPHMPPEGWEVDSREATA